MIIPKPLRELDDLLSTSLKMFYSKYNKNEIHPIGEITLKVYLNDITNKEWHQIGNMRKKYPRLSMWRNIYPVFKDPSKRGSTELHAEPNVYFYLEDKRGRYND